MYSTNYVGAHIFFMFFLFILVLSNLFIFLNMNKTTEGFNKTEIYADYGNSDTNHNVNLPINTNFSCKNMCSSQSKCYITGEQCTSDIDCFGCKPKINIKRNLNNGDNVVGQNDSGKYSYLAPQYSSLTSDIGSKAKLFNKNIFTPIPKINWGPDLWTKSFNIGEKINKDNSSALWDPKKSDYIFTPKYQVRPTITGLFKDEGPLPSNSYL